MQYKFVAKRKHDHILTTRINGVKQKNPNKIHTVDFKTGIIVGNSIRQPAKMQQRLFHQKSGGEARMKTGQWLMSMFYVPLSGLMLLVGRQEGHPAGKNPAPLIPKVLFRHKTDTDTCLTVSFPGQPGNTIPDFNEARADGVAVASAGSYANQTDKHHSIFYRLDALPDTQTIVSKH